MSITPVIIRQPSRAAAFTLVELIVSIAIITLLMAILQPSLHKARQAANAVKCANQQRQIYTASITYGQDYLAIPSSRSYETERTDPSLASSSNVFITNLTNPTMHGSAFAVKNMQGGYLPKLDMRLYWCPSTRTTAALNDSYWNADLQDPTSLRTWSLTSTYAVNYFGFKAAIIPKTDEQYLSGGAIPLRKWDRMNRAMYLTEVNMTYVLTHTFLDQARHNTSANVLFAAGHVKSMPTAEIYNLLQSNDPRFVYGQ